MVHSTKKLECSISGAVMQAKAEEFAKHFNKDGFTCLVSWLEHFKKCHDITYGKFRREAVDWSSQAIEQWINEVWLEKIAEYADEDIFKADETGLFYRMTPNKL